MATLKTQSPKAAATPDKAPTDAASASKGKGKGKKDALRGKSFAEQEEALAPDLSTVPGRKSADADKGGPAEKADFIRRENPRGFFVALSLPPAYASVEAALDDIRAGNVDSSSMTSTRAKWRDEEAAKAAAQHRAPSAITDKALKQVILADPHWSMVLARSQVSNNNVFTQEGAQIAQNQGALAADGGPVQIGRHMHYADKGDIAKKVNGTATAVSELLAAHDPQPDDAKVSKVHALSLASHASANGAGGHGAAATSKYYAADVGKIVGDMAGSLAADVRIALFACHAASKGSVKGDATENGASEGTLADAYRDALNANDKKGGSVMGHRTNGTASMNPNTRFLGADDTQGHADWNWRDVYDAAFFAAEATRLGLTTEGHKERLTATASMFFQRYAWMQDTSTLAAFRAGAAAAFRERYPDRTALLETTEDFTSKTLTAGTKAHAKPDASDVDGEGASKGKTAKIEAQAKAAEEAARAKKAEKAKKKADAAAAKAAKKAAQKSAPASG